MADGTYPVQKVGELDGVEDGDLGAWNAAVVVMPIGAAGDGIGVVRQAGLVVSRHHGSPRYLQSQVEHGAQDNRRKNNVSGRGEHLGEALPVVERRRVAAAAEFRLVSVRGEASFSSCDAPAPIYRRRPLVFLAVVAASPCRQQSLPHSARAKPGYSFGGRLPRGASCINTLRDNTFLPDFSRTEL